MRIVTLVGNRPQFVKAAAVSHRLRAAHEELLVHSGQHYDDELSAVFFRELDLPAPDRELAVGSGSDGEQVGRITHAIEPILRQEKPDLVLVYGDTNTTLAGSLACARLAVPLAHVEAGMRSWNWSMPEERNRILTDHLCDLRLCSTPTAVANLASEGITEGVVLVGDVMADVSLAMAPAADASRALERFGLSPRGYLLVTAHRAGNVDSDERLGRLVEILSDLPGPALFPVHPRTRARLEATGAVETLGRVPGLILTEPLGYLDFLKVLRDAAMVLTDSGGVQKEAYLACVQCLTMRAETEWPETLEHGWNRLVDLDRERVREGLADRDPPHDHPELYGAGQAGGVIVAALERWAAGRPGLG